MVFDRLITAKWTASRVGLQALASLEASDIFIQREMAPGPPLHHVREVHQFLADLTSTQSEIRSVSQLTGPMPPIGKRPKMSH